MCFKESALCKLFIKETVHRAKPMRSLLLKYRHAQMLQMWQHPCSCISANEEELNSGLLVVTAQVLSYRWQGHLEKGEWAWSLDPTQDKHGRQLEKWVLQSGFVIPLLSWDTLWRGSGTWAYIPHWCIQFPFDGLPACHGEGSCCTKVMPLHSQKVLL